jgi:hypothetical protein
MFASMKRPSFPKGRVYKLEKSFSELGPSQIFPGQFSENFTENWTLYWELQQFISQFYFYFVLYIYTIFLINHSILLKNKYL